MKTITNSRQETIAFGKKFAKTLSGGEVILLVGDLGAGKTTFVKGAALGLGVKNTITSPTFVLMRVYKIPAFTTAFPRTCLRRQAAIRGSAGKKVTAGKKNIKRLVHVDAYRGLDLADLENIGALEYFGEHDTICFVEWGGALDNYCREKGIRCKKFLINNINQETREFVY